MFKFDNTKYKPWSFFFLEGEGGGDLYMEGVFPFKNLFLNAAELIFGGAYFLHFLIS